MKKTLSVVLFLLLGITLRAQVALIYTHDGNCELVQGSSIDALYPVSEGTELYVKLLNGETLALSKNDVDSIVFTNRELHVTTHDAADITRTQALLSGSIDWEIPATLGFLVSTNSNPNLDNSINIVADYSMVFSEMISGLNMLTTYYFKAYALMSGVYYYGQTKQFSTVGYMVGDFYPDDDNPIGVVFYTSDNGSHGKIVSVIHTYGKKWDSRGFLHFTDTGGYNTTDGSLNPMPRPYSPVQDWIDDNLGEGWYCPATGELTTICNNVQAINNTLENNGYQYLSGFYWASTQYDISTAYIKCVAKPSGYMGYSNGWSGYNTKDENNSVLGVKKF